jgi:hypothetical protein
LFFFSKVIKGRELGLSTYEKGNASFSFGNPKVETLFVGIQIYCSHKSEKPEVSLRSDYLNYSSATMVGQIVGI